MILNTNISALKATNSLNQASRELEKTLSQISSGKKIVDPSDDAAGLAVGSRFKADIQISGAVKNNLSSAISYTQVQDGALQLMEKTVNRMGELAILAQDVTKTDDDRGLYSLEFEQLRSYLKSLSNEQFNGLDLFKAKPSGVTIDTEGNKFFMEGLALKEDQNAFETPSRAGNYQGNAEVSPDPQILQSGEIYSSIEAGVKLYQNEYGSVFELTEDVSIGDTQITGILTGNNLPGPAGGLFYESDGRYGDRLVFGPDWDGYVDDRKTYEPSTEPQSFQAIAANTGSESLKAGTVFLIGENDTAAKVTLTESKTLSGNAGEEIEGILSGNTMGWLGDNFDFGSRGYGLNDNFQDLISGELGLSTKKGAVAMLDIIKSATTIIANKRGKVGSIQSRLQTEMNNLRTLKENMISSLSVIENANMAELATEYSKKQIIQTSSIQMLTQANTLTQNVLKLIG